jgi:hypothetical protein
MKEIRIVVRAGSPLSQAGLIGYLQSWPYLTVLPEDRSYRRIGATGGSELPEDRSYRRIGVARRR